MSCALNTTIQHRGLDGYIDVVVDQMSNETHSAEDSVYHWFHFHPHHDRQGLVTGQHHLNQGGVFSKAWGPKKGTDSQSWLLFMLSQYNFEKVHCIEREESHVT